MQTCGLMLFGLLQAKTMAKDLRAARASAKHAEAGFTTQKKELSRKQHAVLMLMSHACTYAWR